MCKMRQIFLSFPMNLWRVTIIEPVYIKPMIWLDLGSKLSSLGVNLSLLNIWEQSYSLPKQIFGFQNIPILLRVKFFFYSSPAATYSCRIQVVSSLPHKITPVNVTSIQIVFLHFISTAYQHDHLASSLNQFEIFSVLVRNPIFLFRQILCPRAH